jgi:hypothetical protein
MTFRGLFLALCRRDLGRQPIVVLIAWLLLGAGAAVARQWLAAEHMLDHEVVSRLGRFESTLATVLGFAAAFQLIAHVAEDRLHSWLHGWCGSGGNRSDYVLALYLAGVTAMAMALTAALLGFALTGAVLNATVAPLRSALRLLVGMLVIAGVGAYGLLLGTLIRRVAPAVFLGIVLFVMPLIVGAIVVVSRDLPGLLDSARFWILHLPSPVPVETLRGFLRQTAYIVVAVSVSAWLARHTIGRTA